MIIESLVRNTFDKNMQDFSKCEKHWRVMEQIDLDFVKKSMKSTIDILVKTQPGADTSDLQWENVMKALESGRVVEDVLLLYRAKNDLPKCPLCGASYTYELSSLSRRDNKTHICNVCGTAEAFQDYLGER